MYLATGCPPEVIATARGLGSSPRAGTEVIYERVRTARGTRHAGGYFGQS